jgi:hypothetical protein
MRRAALLGTIIALVAASPAYAANGLVASWPFDEGSGTVVHDVSGNGNNGTISGEVSWVGGFSGSALSFDGSTGRVAVPDSQSLDPADAVTVSVWVRATEPQGDYNYILAKGASRCLAASYGLYTGPDAGLMFYVARNQGLAYTRSPDAGARVWDGNWHFVTGTYDGSSVRLYVDGVQVGSGTPHTGAIDYDFPDNNLFIGHYNTCPTEDFHGMVDAAQIYNRALSASEIRSQYTAQTQTGQAPTPTTGSGSTGTSTGSGGSGKGSTPAHPLSAADRSSVGGISLSGLNLNKPDLTVHLAARKGATPIKSFTVSLPAGLSFSHNLALIRRGVSITRAGSYKLSLSHGKLVVVLSRPAATVAISIRPPAVNEVHSLVTHAKSVIAFNRTKRRQQRKKVLKLTINLGLTDAASRSVLVRAVLTVS